MFKFNFSERDVEDGKCDKSDTDNEEPVTAFGWFPASEIEVTTEQIRKEYSNSEVAKTFVGDRNIKIVCSENIASKFSASEHENIVKAESQHSDLLPAIYEGGLKIWECSYDLGKLLIDSDVDLKRKRVLDLGCGAGVLGILALLKGSIVHFQDYNAEVIRYSTIPNVLLNLENCRAIEKCKFFCGDWKSFVELSAQKYIGEEEKYDIVMTSETIYNPANLAKLYQVFKRRLKKNGTGYVAGKTYYFGVGGGTRQFETLVGEDGIFDIETFWKSTDGLQREILKLKRFDR